MPVMLSLDSATEWLNCDQDKQVLLDERLTDVQVYKVDRRVNNSLQENAELIQPCKGVTWQGNAGVVAEQRIQCTTPVND